MILAHWLDRGTQYLLMASSRSERACLLLAELAGSGGGILYWGKYESLDYYRKALLFRHFPKGMGTVPIVATVLQCYN